MSNDERIYKQLAELSSSLIKALEAIERELTQYIEITDKRLNKLEEKMHKIDSLVEVSERGLVKTMQLPPVISEKTTLAQPLPIPKTQIELPKEKTKMEIPAKLILNPPVVEAQTHTPILTKLPPIPAIPVIKPTLNKDELLTIPEPKKMEEDNPSYSIATELEEKKKKEEDKDKEDLMSALKMIDSL